MVMIQLKYVYFARRDAGTELARIVSLFGSGFTIPLSLGIQLQYQTQYVYPRFSFGTGAGVVHWFYLYSPEGSLKIKNSDVKARLYKLFGEMQFNGSFSRLAIEGLILRSFD
ncbi:hypothetical protein JN11_00401 [Mucilaginibacter frigoritolerans]|uniref:Uncharacterized protein n=2 Tax=Mucilaginibacter frigoritolerans TaxID=652788 RepID=A0A562UHQ8_9SPHI|nr:hypothetical protein JN11_00401 [Mucilaginibacter frigoritolerans]